MQNSTRRRSRDGPCPPVSAQEVANHTTAAPVVTVSRARGEVSVDGRLDETAWSAATPVSSFTQRDPNAGAPATERTEVRFLFDGDAVYIGARLHDSSGRVSTRLGRRDNDLSGSDWFTVTLDSYHSHPTAFAFGSIPAALGATRRSAVAGTIRR